MSFPGRRPDNGLTIEVIEGDIITFGADLVAFKYAQAFYGADWQAAQALAGVGVEVKGLQPKAGEHRLVDPSSALAAGQVLFVGVPPLHQFRYRHLRDFGIQVIRILAECVPTAVTSP